MPKTHVIVISSVRPAPTSAGQLILFRHLVSQPGMTFEVHGSEPARLTVRSALRRAVGRLGKTRWRKLAEDFFALWAGRWLDEHLPQGKDFPAGTVVLTVAHGDGCQAAMRFARRHCLPLVTVFHDWWPDCAAVHEWCRRPLERQFRQLYHTSATALCVCEGMRSHLGGHPRAMVLPPIGAGDEPTPDKREAPPSKPFTVLYSGNLRDYGPMLGAALLGSAADERVFIQARGSNPQWPDELLSRMRDSGQWLDFAPRAELEQWLATADAFLVPMSFDPAMRRRMECCFPSKLVDFARFGKPLVIWGPDYCSATRWGGRDERALCVTDADPRALVRELRQLADSAAERRRLGEAACRAFATEFDPNRLQEAFRGCLNSLFPDGRNNR